MYDLIIIGSGPAGLTASIYASRYRIKHLVIGSQLGGAMSLASSVENYPGFPKISGMELTEKMVKQVKALGGEIINDTVVEIKSDPFDKTQDHPERSRTDEKLKVKNYNAKFKILTESGKEYETRAVILATGTRRRELGVPGEKEYLGRGVSYCSVCDAGFFSEKTVAVIGGANAAVMSAVHLAEFGKKVYLIYRRKPLRAEPVWVERVEKNPKIKIIYETNVTEILGDGQKVTGVEFDRPYEEKTHLDLDGVFVEIGGVPGTELVKPLGVEMDKKGYIKVGPDMVTNVPGVFAAGDIANAAGELQQIVTAASEGAIAATSVYKCLFTGS